LAAALACLAGIAFATLSPIDLRPQVADIKIEHVGAFLVLGILFGLAYPRHLLVIGACLLIVAVGLEAAQHLVPGRHGRVPDLVQKVVGSGIGLSIAATLDRFLQRFDRVGRSGSSAS
jgi:VanZ family protein